MKTAAIMAAVIVISGMVIDFSTHFGCVGCHSRRALRVLTETVGLLFSVNAAVR